MVKRKLLIDPGHQVGQVDRSDGICARMCIDLVRIRRYMRASKLSDSIWTKGKKGRMFES